MRGKKIYPSEERILSLLKAGALISAAFLFPKAASTLAKTLIKNKDQEWLKYRRAYLKRNISKLAKKGLVSFTKEKGEEVIKLTNKGEKEVLKIKLKDLKIKKPKAWDGKWRVVIFDIPHSHKKARDVFRKKLQELGFYKLQKSVFVCPYPCFEELQILRELYGIKPFTEFLLVEELEHEGKIRQKFNL